MVQITAVYTMDLIWFQVVPNLTVVASTASPAQNRRSENTTMVSKSENVTGAEPMSDPLVSKRHVSMWSEQKVCDT